jgi:hypothetical protein
LGTFSQSGRPTDHTGRVSISRSSQPVGLFAWLDSEDFDSVDLGYFTSTDITLFPLSFHGSRVDGGSHTLSRAFMNYSESFRNSMTVTDSIRGTNIGPASLSPSKLRGNFPPRGPSTQSLEFMIVDPDSMGELDRS